MKKTRALTISELSIDAVDYLFVEWLCRLGVFSAFRSNCGFDKDRNRSFRTVLRRRIQNALHSSHSGVGDLVSTSFLFTDTPEGYAFWTEVSFDWRRFCINFQNNFK